MLSFARPEKPLSESRVALVTTGGVHLPEQPRFDIDDPVGDCSYREIPNHADRLTWTHAYHRPGEGSDLDAVFPLWTLRSLADEGEIGDLNHRHFSFMGAIHDHGPLIEHTAPEVAGKLVEDGVDAALLTLSCPLCHRVAGPISEAVEERGIPTVTIAMESGVEATRVLRVPFPYNEPAGRPGNAWEHRRVVLAALRLIWDLDRPAEMTL